MQRAVLMARWNEKLYGRSVEMGFRRRVATECMCNISKKRAYAVIEYAWFVRGRHLAKSIFAILRSSPSGSAPPREVVFALSAIRCQALINKETRAPCRTAAAATTANERLLNRRGTFTSDRFVIS